MSSVVPVIMCGGAGTRLWPASRRARPKQFLRLFGEHSLFQETVLRVSDRELFAKPICITNEDYRFVVAEQLNELGVDAAVVLEPARRDSAPALCAGCLIALQKQKDAIVLAIPADHRIRDTDGFRATIRGGLDAAAAGYLVTFGARPDHPATGYGYIAPADKVAAGDARHVASFVEKPDADTACEYIERKFLWNTGNFLLSAEVFLQELNAYEPSIVPVVSQAVDGARRDLDFLRLDRAGFESAKAISIDYAVMERTSRAAVVEACFDWSDIGSWTAVHALSEKDERGNAQSGDVHVLDSRNTYVRSDHRLVTAIGVEDLVVVANRDSVMIAHCDKVENIKDLVEVLDSDRRIEVNEHPKSFRPWGSFEVVDTGERFLVKRITVVPGGRLSLQSHRHRAEHWVVVRGTAFVRIGDEEKEVCSNESIYIPLGAVHRLENRESTVLELIEVQSGSYLGEDDIERFDDVYGRHNGDE